MKHYISTSEHYLTLQDTAEHILVRRLVAKELGDQDMLTRRLAKLMCASIDFDTPIEPYFFGDECDLILEALHNCAISDRTDWPQAQASRMLAEAI
jgi:hypothetical protein